MWRAVVMAAVFAAGCAGQHEPATRAPLASSDWRCILRISHRGTFADGEPMSRAAAVAHCKRAPGGVVVVVEAEDSAIHAEWDEMRSALQREGVKIYVRGPLCYDPRPRGCWPIATPAPHSTPAERRIVVVPLERQLAPSPPAPAPPLQQGGDDVQP